MSDTQTAIAGGYNLIECSLINYDGSRKIDVSQIFGELIITEELFKPYVYGNITLIDRLNVLNRFPIIGEETLTITFASLLRPQVPARSYTFFCYRCSEHSMSSQSKVQTYTLFFISYDQYTAAKNPVSRNFKGNVSDIIQGILLGNLQTSVPVNIQQTNNDVNLTLPRKTYFDVIEYMKKHAVSSIPNDSNYWLFYQNNTGYNFVTLTNLIQQSLKRQQQLQLENFYWSDLRNINLQLDPFTHTRNISQGSYVKIYDTFEGMRLGYYGVKNGTYDLNQRQYIESTQNYLDFFNKINHVDSTGAGMKQSLKFLQDQKSQLTGYYFNVISSLSSDYSTYTQNKLNATLNYRMLEEMPLVINVMGDTIIQSGDILGMDLPEMIQESNNLDQYRSGNYMIGRLSHIFQANRYYNQINLYKDCNAQTIVPDNTISVSV